MSLSMFCKNCDWDAGLVHLTPNSSPLIHLPGAALLHHCDDHDDTHDDKSPVPSWSRSTRPSSQSKCGSHLPPPEVGKIAKTWVGVGLQGPRGSRGRPTRSQHNATDSHISVSTTSTRDGLINKFSRQKPVWQLLSRLPTSDVRSEGGGGG